jgi:flagellin-like hook-associated protein FlgL
VPAAPGSNVAVTDSHTGAVLYVDTTAMDRVGLESVHAGGTYDVFNALISVRDAIMNSRDMSAAQQTTLLENAMDALTEATDGLTQATTSNGAQLQIMNSLEDSTKNMAHNSQQQADALENADITDVAADLARRQVLYEMSLAITSKLLSMSLLNYM